MKKIFSFLIISTCFLVASAFTMQAIINWKINNEKAEVKFIMQAHGQELIGNFKSANGDIVFDENDLKNASIKCQLKVAEINTGVDIRDESLQSKDWFNGKAFPFVTFVSDSVVVNDQQKIAYGKLTLKGISKATSIPFTFENTAEGGLFKGSFILKLSTFDIPKADDTDSDEVKVQLVIPVKKVK